MMLIAPPHVHKHVEVLFSNGTPSIFTLAEPGVQGAVVLGMQGIGVNTPIAAVVAAATAGFAGDMHMPNDVMFATGMKSLTLAATRLPHFTRLAGRVCKDAGATPMLQVSCAVMTATCGIGF